MSHRFFTWAVALTVLTEHTLFSASFDWPQWQGPDRNAVSKERGLLQEWPKDGPPLAWKIKGLGGGYSAPSVAAGRIFGMSSRGEDEVVWALSEPDGKELWATRLGPAVTQGMPQGKEGAGCTPTVDGERLYVIGLSGDLACLQVKDGQIVWRRSLTDDLGGRLPTWRYNESPLVDGDKVICTPGGKETTLVALDKLTGKTIWATQVPEPAGGSSESSGGGGGGAGGRGGFGPGNMLASQMISQGDKNGDQKLSQAEFSDLANAWFDKLDSAKAGKLTQEQFTSRFGDLLPPPPGDGGSRGGRGFSPGRFVAPGFFSAANSDKDAALTRDEFKGTFAKWASDWDSEKSGSLTEQKLREGLNAALPRPEFGGGGGGRGGGRGGFSESGAAYASAIAIDFEGQRQYVQFTSKSLVGVAASDGKLLWRYDRPANRSAINCSTPLYHDGKIFAASAYGAGGGLVKLSKDVNGGVKAEEVWFSKNMENHHGGMLVVDGCLYGANGGNEGGYLVCLDFETGNVLWNERDSDKRRAPKGSVALADGRIYYRTEDGHMLLIEPNRKEYIEHGRFEQPDRSEKPAWPHPVIANGKLYIRDQNVLLCYEVKARGK